MRLLKGISFLLLMTAGAFTAIVFLIPSILLLPVHSILVIQWRCAYTRQVLTYFFNFAASLLLNLCGVKLFFYSNDSTFIGDRGSLIICNHRTRIDWMFSWCYAAFVQTSGDIKMILKDSLRFVPIFGWGMQLAMYIFLSRDRSKDLPHLEQIINYLIVAGGKPSIFIFPEGTDLSQSNLDKCRAFAREKGLPELSQVLYPKPSGFAACFSILRGHGRALHDITMAYKDHTKGSRTSEWSMIKGEFPREVHICVRRFEIDTLPSSRSQLDQWLRDSYLVKEVLLNQFYENGGPVFTASAGSEQKQENKESGPEIELRSRTTGTTDEDLLKKMKETVCWPPLLAQQSLPVGHVYFAVGLMLLLLAGLLTYSWLCWVVMVLVIVCVGSRLVGGFDVLELSLHSHMMLHEKST